MLTCDQIQQHIDDLDAHIPKQDADLLIWQEGDSPDCEIIANRIGCLRFGIEMLKVAIVEADLRKVGTDISVKYMEVPRWSLHVKQVTRSEDAGAFLPQFPTITWKTHVMSYFEIFLGIFACVCLFTGFWEVLVWAWHLLV